MDNVSLVLKVGGVTIPSNPIFGDDVKIKVSKEDKQVFYRTKVDGKIKFVGEDFDFIAACSHNTEFTLCVYRGSTLLGESTFLKSDCDLNYDDKVCSVKVATTDKYEKFLASYDNKYNLPKLAPATTPLTMNKRPVLQFYFVRDTKITNAFGNMSFEVDARSGAEDKTDEDILACGFSKVFHWRKMVLPNFPSYPSIQGVSGTYTCKLDTIVVGSRCMRTDNAYYLEYVHYTEDGYDTHLWVLYNSNGTVFRDSSNNRLFVQAGDGSYETYDYCRILLGASFGGSAPTVGFCSVSNRVCYARALSDYSGDYTGETRTAFSDIEEDIAEDNYNYKYAWTVSFLNLPNQIRISSEVQAAPTEWGVDGDGNYFVRPTPFYATDAVYPIGWNMWIPISIWFESSTYLDSTLRYAFNTSYQLKDAYSLHESIGKLLTEMGVDVSFNSTSAYSKFFYGSGNTLMDTIPSPSMRGQRVYVTPITNVKKTRYEQPARKGDITLKQILDMLRDVYQCYWYIDGSNRLCIEHISYFKNNKSYGLYTPTPSIDLTAMKDMPNGLPWSFGTNELGFDKSNCPNRYEFEWADESTEQFKGYAIDILDKATSEKQKERVNVSNFVADVDYVVIYPNGVSDDIYAVIEASSYDNSVGIFDISVGNNTPIYCMQNGCLSLLFAEKYYYPYDLGGWDAVSDGVAIPVLATRHLGTQSVGVPLAGLGVTIPDTMAIIKTGLGIGWLKDADIDANTLYAKTKLTLGFDRDDYKNSLSVTKVAYAHGSYAIQVYNNSTVLLDVAYVYNGTANTITIAEGSAVLVAYGSSSISPSDVKIVYAVQNKEHNTPIDNLIKRYNSRMSATISQGSARTITIAIDGNHYGGGYDFAYLKVHLVNRSRVTIAPSTQADYDFGYAATKPCLTMSEVEAVNGEYAYGTVAQEKIFAAGQDIFVGYSKNYSSYGNNDSVVITIEEI